MPYIIETWDKPAHQHIREAERTPHLDYLYAERAKLLACGAKLEDDGSGAGGGLYVVDVETRAEAEAFIAADPFSKAGLFARVEIKRWRKAFLNGECFMPPWR